MDNQSETQQTLLGHQNTAIKYGERNLFRMSKIFTFKYKLLRRGDTFLNNSKEHFIFRLMNMWSMPSDNVSGILPLLLISA